MITVEQAENAYRKNDAINTIVCDNFNSAAILHNGDRVLEIMFDRGYYSRSEVLHSIEYSNESVRKVQEYADEARDTRTKEELIDEIKLLINIDLNEFLQYLHPAHMYHLPFITKGVTVTFAAFSHGSLIAGI
jgi:hypothetical protein